MNYFYISGWNTPQALLADFIAPVAGPSYKAAWQELSYVSHSDINSVYQAWQQQIGNEPCVIVAWSLGGNLAIDYLQNHQNNCQGLLCMATNISFVDPYYGMPQTRFSQFYMGFEQQPQLQHKRFMQLISKGANKEVSRHCRSYYAHHQPSKHFLRQLLWLQTLQISAQSLPTCLIECWFARDDVLVPKKAADLVPASREFSGSHVFFLEHAEQCQHLIQQMLMEIDHG